MSIPPNECARCGTALSNDLRFCTKCGEPIPAEAPAPTALSTPPAVLAPARVYVHSGSDRGTSFALTAHRTIVGRGTGSGVQLSDPLVSSSHCAITAGDELASIEDLGSANGTIVDGATIPSGTVRAVPFGAMLQLGDTIAEIVGPGMNPRTAAPTVMRGSTASTGVRSSKRAKTLIGVVAVIAIGALAVGIWSATRGSTTPLASNPVNPNDPAWVMKTQGHAVLQVFACEGTSEAKCDDTIQGGTGSVLDLGDGLILTNFHVIADDKSEQPLDDLWVGVSVAGEDYVRAKVVGFSACDDLALLQIDGDAQSLDLAQVTLGDGSGLEVGNQVVVLGYPGTVATDQSGDQQLQLTAGNISALGVVVENYLNLVQMSAPINHGNSGGPVFDLNGKQVGVATLGDSNDTQGIFYAISIDQVNKVLPDIRGGTKQAGLSSCPK